MGSIFSCGLWIGSFLFSLGKGSSAPPAEESSVFVSFLWIVSFESKCINGIPLDAIYLILYRNDYNLYTYYPTHRNQHNT